MWLWLIFPFYSAAFATDSDELSIQETYSAWVETVKAKNIKEWSSFLAPNALFMPPGIPPLATEEAILEYYQKSFADPEFSLNCKQLDVHVAESRDVAWARGICEATFTDPSGQRANGTSRWFKIWLKQPDGSWKCRVNTWNYEDPE